MSETKETNITSKGFYNITSILIEFDSNDHAKIECSIECHENNIRDTIANIAELHARTNKKEITGIIADLKFVC